MSDFKASVKIEFTMFDKTYKLDDYGTYYGWDTGGISPRVAEFFREAWDDAQARYAEMLHESRREEREKEQERLDRAEYERLKAKYGS
jgi:hypothetical protein